MKYFTSISQTLANKLINDYTDNSHIQVSLCKISPCNNYHLNIYSKKYKRKIKVETIQDFNNIINMFTLLDTDENE